MNLFQTLALEDVVRIAIAIVVIFAALISTLYVIWWGFLMIVSGWNEEKIKPAVNHIRHAIIWLILLVSILYVFPVIMNLVGFPYGEFAKPASVFSTIQEIFGAIFWTEITPPDTLLDSNELPTNYSSEF